MFFFFFLLGTLAGWNCCCGASKIAQTAHTVCFMVMFYDRLDVSIDRWMDVWLESWMAK